MSKLSDVIGRGVTASKPAAGVAGRLYYDTTLNKLQRDSGTTWEDVEPTAAAAAITVREVDSAPSISATSVVFPNGTLTDSGGGVATYTPGPGTVSRIAQIVVGAGGVATIDFSSIPATYENLQIILVGRTNQAAVTSDMMMRINNDTGANYDQQIHLAYNTTQAAAGNAAQTAGQIGYVVGASAPTGAASSVVIQIPGYARTVFQKQALASHAGNSAVAVGGLWNSYHAVNWRSTAAIDRVTLYLASGSFVEGTVATLYGIN